MLRKITTCVVLLLICSMCLHLYCGVQITQLILKTLVSSESENLELPIFKAKPLVIWTIDFHATPAYDLMMYLKPMGVTFIYRNYDKERTRCSTKDNCNSSATLKAISPAKLINLNYQDIPRFYQAYKDDPVMKSVDAFVCYHLVSLCELYEPFNKSLIIIATLRYEYGRFGKESWTILNRNLIKYASQPWNVVGANNLYDAEYIKYFTGIQPQHLPNWGNYTNQTYSASRSGFLIASSHERGFIKLFLQNFTEVCKNVNCSVNLMFLRQKYPQYKYADVAAHQGMVYVPYQVSVMSFFEQYRMNIPIFAPSRELLAQWEIKHHIMRNKRHGYMYSRGRNRSIIESHLSQRQVPDPNSFSEEAIRYWGKFCDYYQYPHITHYDSIEDLIRVLQSISTEQLQSISARMKIFNIEENKRLRKIWKNILLKIAYQSINHPH